MAEQYFGTDIFEQYHNDYEYELAMRNMSLPLGLNICFSGNDTVCARAEHSIEFAENVEANYIFSLILACMNGLGAFAFAAQYTKPEKKDDKARFIVG
jgi:hypothetical protein